MKNPLNSKYSKFNYRNPQLVLSITKLDRDPRVVKQHNWKN